MSLFRHRLSEAELNQFIPAVARFAGVKKIVPDYEKNTLMTEFLVSDDNVQPHGILHGGVSVLVAETLGSIAGHLCLEEQLKAVGQTLSASHIRAMPKGEVIKALTSPVHIGRRSQIWNTDFHDQKGRLTCRVSLTLAVIGG